MTVTVNTVSQDGFRHSIKIDDYELFTDVPKSAGGEGSAPSPHDLSLIHILCGHAKPLEPAYTGLHQHWQRPWP